MSRDHVVSVRLTDAERVTLDAMGGLAAVLRQLLHTYQAAAVPPLHAVTGNAPYAVTWDDGTFGAQWPQSKTA